MTYFGLFFILFLIAVLVLLFLRRSARRLAFFPIFEHEGQPSHHNLPWEEVHLRTKDNKKIHGWFLPHPEAIAAVLFLHGNAGNISHRLDELALWHQIKMSVLIIDYRGFGKSQGTPSEKGVYRDAQAAYTYLTEEKGIPAQEIVCFGRSLGGAVALELASRVSLGALILSSTFTSAKAMIDYLFFPWIAKILKWVSPVHFPSVERIKKITCPVLLVHGENDSLVPARMARELYEAAPQPKMCYTVPQGGHNDTFLIGGKKYWYLLHAFIFKVICEGDVSSLKHQQPFSNASDLDNDKKGNT